MLTAAVYRSRHIDHSNVKHGNHTQRSITKTCLHFQQIPRTANITSHSHILRPGNALPPPIASTLSRIPLNPFKCTCIYTCTSTTAKYLIFSRFSVPHDAPVAFPLKIHNPMLRDEFLVRLLRLPAVKPYFFGS
jgi:hypothetical protein